MFLLKSLVVIVSVNCRRMCIKFCSSSKHFVVLVLTVIKLRMIEQRRKTCAYMVDFVSPVTYFNVYFLSY